MEAYVSWAAGDDGDGKVLRRAEHKADAVRRELAQQLRVAFTTPVDAEDLFTLSERLDGVINMAKNVVRDADLLAIRPEGATSAMAAEALAGVRHLREALAAIPANASRATDEADAAVKNVRHIEKQYARAIRGLAEQPDPHTALLLREHFHDCLQVGERIELVADRVWYAVVKEQ